MENVTIKNLKDWKVDISSKDIEDYAPDEDQNTKEKKSGNYAQEIYKTENTEGDDSLDSSLRNKDDLSKAR